MEATTTERRRNTRPISYYWGVVKDMDDSQKLELVTMLVNSVKPKLAEDMTMQEMLEGYPNKHYTKAELYALLDEAEANIAAGNTISSEEMWRELEEEFAREDAEEDTQYAASYTEELQRKAV